MTCRKELGAQVAHKGDNEPQGQQTTHIEKVCMESYEMGNNTRGIEEGGKQGKYER